MTPFTHLDGRAAPLAMANVDTDQIIPKQFLKTVDREGLGKGLFYDLRFDEAGNEKPGFVLNAPAYAGVKHRVSGTLANTDLITTNTFFLGVHPGLTPEMIRHMIGSIEKFLHP